MKYLPYLKYWPVLAIVLALSALAYGSHESRMRGIAEERAHEAAQQAELHKRAASKLMDSVRVRDSRIAKLTKSYVVTRTRYKTVHDSIFATDTVEIPEVIQLADSALAQADSVIAEQAHQIVTLKAVESERSQQIEYLNHQIDAQVRGLKHTKRQGWVRTALAAGFGVVLGVASQK